MGQVYPLDFVEDRHALGKTPRARDDKPCSQVVPTVCESVYN
jgi:hypothetical protein